MALSIQVEWYFKTVYSSLRVLFLAVLYQVASVTYSNMKYEITDPLHL